MSSNSDDINDKIKAYEPMIRRILKNYKITFDHEDISQELRMVVWKVLIDKENDTEHCWLENDRTKFSTFMYYTLVYRLQDILQVQYKIFIKTDKDKEGNYKKPDAPTKNEIAKRKLANPKSVNSLSKGQARYVFEDYNSSEALIRSIDLSLFEDSLTGELKEYWTLRLENNSIREIAKIKGVGRRSVETRLKKLNKLYKKFIEEGE